jgi:predicted dehydrogenase
MTHPQAGLDRRAFLGTTGGLAAAALIPEALLGAPRWRPREPVRVGLAGAGRQGRAILAELAAFEGVSVSAVCDVVPERLSSGLRRVQGAAGFASVEELLDGAELDALIVATPTHLHLAPCLAALERGLAVYCEAPLAHTAEDCRELARAARASGKAFQVGYQARSNPIYALARSFLRSGSLRDLVLLRAQHHKKTEWTTPGATPELERALNWRLDPEVSLGLLGEVGSHQLDAFHWFLGRYPRSVRGSGAVLAWHDGREVADTARAVLAFDGGLELAYSATIGNSYEGQYELFAGTMAAIKLVWTFGWMFKEADAPTQGWEVYANRQTFHNDEGITLIADATKLAAQGRLAQGIGLPNTPLYYALEGFLKSVSEGAAVACSAGDGLRTTLVAIEAARAVREGAERAIDPESLKDE